MADERVAPKDFEPEPCEEAGCKAPNGECARWYEAGYVSCPVGPYRNYANRVERRSRDRRKKLDRRGPSEGTREPGEEIDPEVVRRLVDDSCKCDPYSPRHMRPVLVNPVCPWHGHILRRHAPPEHGEPE